MALDIKGLKRVFILKKGNGTLTLEDPDSRMSLSEVTDFYSINYPELTTATLHGPELEEDRAVYRFKTTIGTKGQAMAKKTNPKKKEETACRQLSELQTEDLARLIISEAGCTDISRGTGSRKKRRLPPAGTVMIF